MNKRDVAKAAGFMLLGSLITLALLAIWIAVAFRKGFPT